MFMDSLLVFGLWIFLFGFVGLILVKRRRMRISSQLLQGATQKSSPAAEPIPKSNATDN